MHKLEKGDERELQDYFKVETELPESNGTEQEVDSHIGTVVAIFLCCILDI